MNAHAYVGRDGICGASLKPYGECPGPHAHTFTLDEGRLYRGYATLHPKPDYPPRPYTDPLPGEPA